MKITKHNYEEFILDFIEGKLSENDNILFQKFLDSNPDVENEILNFENVILPEENIVFEEKYLLKKTEFSQNFSGNYLEELCIADIEKDITDEQKKDLENIFTEFPEKIAVYDSFKKTKLIPNLEIKYTNKEKLKKKHVLMRPNFVYFASSVAASLILFFSIIGLNKNEVYKTRSYSQIENRFENNKTVFTKTLVSKTDLQVSNNKLEKTIYNSSKIDNPTNVIDNQIDIVLRKDDNLDKIVVSSPKLQKEYEHEILNFNTKENFEDYNKMAMHQSEKNFFEKKGIEKINAWNVAQVAVNNYNNLTENNVSLDGKFDRDGDLKAVSFNSQVFGFYTNKVKKLGINQ